MTKRPFKAKGNRVIKQLELVHTDVCGPMSVQARGGYEHFISFTDDYSKYGYVYLCATSLNLLKSFENIGLRKKKAIKCPYQAASI